MPDNSDEEEKGTQTEVDASSDKSQDTETFFGGPETLPENDEEDKSEVSGEADKEAKKERDFEKGMNKYRDLYKATKAELEAAKSQTDKPVVPATNEEPNPEEEGLKILKNIIEEAISPLKSELEKSKEDTILSEFEKKPYVNTLAPEINEAMKGLDSKLPLSERLDRAYEKAVSANLETIIRVSKELGKEQGYKDRNFKSKQGGLKDSPNRNASPDDLEERLNRGEVGAQEYAERDAEIQQIYKRQVGL